MARQHTAIRYAVVGLGHIAQVAVLPAFAHAGRNSRLTALVSDHPAKLRTLARKYRVSMHAEYALRHRITRPGVKKPRLVHAKSGSR
jgi:glucose-fructose oxidoreductase